MLKVLNALAEYLDMPLGELLEGVVLHAFDGRLPFGTDTIQRIKRLKEVYGFDLTANDAHRLAEKKSGRGQSLNHVQRAAATRRRQREHV